MKIYKCCGHCGFCPVKIYSACWEKHKHKLKEGDKINIAPSKCRQTFDPIKKGRNK